MKNQFRELMAEVESLYDELLNASAFKCAAVPSYLTGKSGVYLFSEDDHPMYIGRTDNFYSRLTGHRRKSHNTATFAFLLARRETGIQKASYQPSGSRPDLLKNNPAFALAFDRARERIAVMDVRIIEEPDSVKQAILEIYASFVSGALHNDFKNH